MSFCHTTVLGLVASLVLGISAQAAVVEWTFSATVRDIDGNAAGMADYGVTTGTILSATFLLDNTANGELISDNVWFNDSVFDIDVSAGDFRVSLDTSLPEFNTVLVRDQDVDAVAVSAAVLISDGTNSDPAFVALQFIGSNGQLVSDTLFPSIPDFTHVDSYDSDVLGGTFFSFQATIDGVFTTVTAEIFGPQARIVPVPVPGAVLLLASGLLTVFGMGRRK